MTPQSENAPFAEDCGADNCVRGSTGLRSSAGGRRRRRRNDQGSMIYYEGLIMDFDFLSE
jgi:hypothetical protein